MKKLLIFVSLCLIITGCTKEEKVKSTICSKDDSTLYIYYEGNYVNRVVTIDSTYYDTLSEALEGEKEANKICNEYKDDIECLVDREDKLITLNTDVRSKNLKTNKYDKMIKTNEQDGYICEEK